jgi:TonB-dependent SusC/RagA subfamily outer membrane receptor
MKLNTVILLLAIFFALGCAKNSNPNTNVQQNEISDPYGTQSTSKYTGSAKVVKNQGHNVGLDQYLNQVAGVSVIGQGSEATIMVRGYNSFTAGNEPLFVVNGSVFGGSFSTLFNSINTMDIKNVTVLKDASSTSIYGSRGANGVILISMKKNH